MKLVTCVAAVLVPSLAIAFALSSGNGSFSAGARPATYAANPAGNLAIPRCATCGHISEIAAAEGLPYRVTVALETGGSRTVDIDSVEGLARGTRVIIVRDNVRVLDPFLFQ